jgi:hypothetical protein
MELEELKRLAAVDAKSILSRRVEPLGTEYEVVRDALVGMATLRIGERELKIPGLDRHRELIIKVVAEFKQKKMRNVMPLQFAKADDITLEPLRPETFGLDNWVRTGLSVGTVDLIPQTAGTFNLETDAEIIVITDFCEAKAIPVITAILPEVDGVKQNPLEMRKDLKISDLHLYELDYPLIADTSLNIDGKVEASGDSELFPLGVRICLGRKLSGLT